MITPVVDPLVHGQPYAALRPGRGGFAMTRFPIALAASAAVLGLAGPAAAQASRDYRVEARQSQMVDLTICSPAVRMDVAGDGDTDVDFTVFDQNNSVVYQDLDTDDQTSTTLYGTAGGRGGCQTWRIQLDNLGNVWNRVRVTLTDVPVNGGDGGGPVNPRERSVSTYRVEPQDTYWVDLTLCSPRIHFEGVGNGQSDVDYVIFDPNNREVFSDYALHDRAAATIRTNAGNGRCEVYRLRLNNLGTQWNPIRITMWNLP
jgi:hypothetical protein